MRFMLPRDSRILLELFESFFRENPIELPMFIEVLLTPGGIGFFLGEKQNEGIVRLEGI